VSAEPESDASARTFDDLFALITDELFDKIKAGVPIEPTSIINPDEVMCAAIHCCVNGPVGVNKSTNFPGIERDVKIKDLFNKKISNKSWRLFCDHVAEYLTRKLSDRQLAECQTMQLHRSLWPQYDL
jgi:hypothetical protein